MSKIISFELEVDVSTFLSLFWFDYGEFINSFLANELRYQIFTLFIVIVIIFIK